MSIDLFGQVAAEGIGPHQFSGTGGQGDYIRGAQMSKGGKSFLAFKSTVGQNPDGSLKSRIVPYFPPATIVTTPRSDVPICGDRAGRREPQAPDHAGPRPRPDRPGSPGLPPGAGGGREKAGHFLSFSRQTNRQQPAPPGASCCPVFYEILRYKCHATGSLADHLVMSRKYWWTDVSSSSSGWKAVTSWFPWRAATMCPSTSASTWALGPTAAM